MFVEADVDYECLDGDMVTVPCCDVIRTRGRKLCEQRAYLDQSPIWVDSVESKFSFDDALGGIRTLRPS